MALASLAASFIVARLPLVFCCLLLSAFPIFSFAQETAQPGTEILYTNLSGIAMKGQNFTLRFSLNLSVSAGVSSFSVMSPPRGSKTYLLSSRNTVNIGRPTRERCFP